MSNSLLIDKDKIDQAALSTSEGLVNKAESALAWALGLEVNSQADVDVATETLQEVKQIYKQVEESRRFLVDPLNAHVKAINEIFKRPRGICEEAERLAKRKVADYVVAENLRARAAQKAETRKAEGQRKRHQTLAAKAAEAGDHEKAQEQIEKAHAVMEDVVTPEAQAAGGSHLTTRWVGVVTDLPKFLKGIVDGVIPLDPDLIQVSQKVLNEKARAMKGTVKWPGVRFGQITDLTIKS